MEEWIGTRWHRWISRLADRSHPQAAVELESVRRSVTLMLRAGGGSPALRITPASARRHGGARDWVQRLAGAGQRAERAQLDAQTLALPAKLAVLPTREQNHALYLWLAALASSFESTPGDWIARNRLATGEALVRFPGLRTRWEALRDALLAQRPPVSSLRGTARAAEEAVQAALRGESGAPAVCTPDQVQPVWLWLDPVETPSDAAGRRAAQPMGPRGAAPPSSAARRRARRVRPQVARPALLLPSRTEWIATWSEHLPLDRDHDDEDDEGATAAADDMDQLAIAADDGRRSASRVRFDLDLPSASADDVLIADDETLPEWDWHAGRLRPEHCAVQWLVARDASPLVPTPALRATARRVRRRLEVLRAAPQWQRACPDGDDLDLDAWVRDAARSGDDADAEPAVFRRRVRADRSLATLLLADLSLSTDAHVNDEARVIDVVRDALFVFGDALHACGDPFAMVGFSSVRRQHVRLHHLKGFDEAWSPRVTARLAALEPGFYTRMGAAVRAATRRLLPRPERQRLLLLLTDGKPNDIDSYEGRYGLEDTRQAVREARALGLTPLCLSIDEEAHDYLPHLFGSHGWAQVRRPTELPARLAELYARVTRP